MGVPESLYGAIGSKLVFSSNNVLKGVTFNLVYSDTFILFDSLEMAHRLLKYKRFVWSQKPHLTLNNNVDHTGPQFPYL
jgi:hypothetical protein